MLDQLLLDKLAAVEVRYEELSILLADPAVLANRQQMQKLGKEHSDLRELVETLRVYRDVSKRVNEARELQKDPEMRELARQEETELTGEQERLEKTLKELLMPKDPNDDKNIILEIRAGTGGEEAALFAAELFRMYSRFAERRRWGVEILSMSSASAGGLKEVTAGVAGHGAFSQLKYESGVHRVQRVPATEAQGRIHTSTATVAGDARGRGRRHPHRPEGPQDRRDAFGRPRRAVGQHHRLGGAHPPHPERACWSTASRKRSQHKNKAMAMKLLRAKLYDIEEEKRQAAERDARRSQIGSRRPLREDPHLQLPAGSADRSPHRPDAPQPARHHGRRSDRRHRQPARALPGRSAQATGRELTERAMRIVILDSFAADQGDVDGFWAGLRALGELEVFARSDDDAVVARCRGADAVLTNKVAFPAAAFRGASRPALRRRAGDRHERRRPRRRARRRRGGDQRSELRGGVRSRNT